ncbi:unnamed protein product [Darwinula stevensoni]|uniref:AIG1-type G domain-containing protein n=1 Tax=Darwinula stevensoni TaxID=69355 RepID=A0A7R8XCT3_9CRUS|nr:unnamed protein product [Darwinula stevensoni]CAG0887898.1 unnamed protein product [Darwinula stevensoni]
MEAIDDILDCHSGELQRINIKKVLKEVLKNSSSSVIPKKDIEAHQLLRKCLRDEVCSFRYFINILLDRGHESLATTLEKGGFGIGWMSPKTHFHQFTSWSEVRLVNSPPAGTSTLARDTHAPGEFHRLGHQSSSKPSPVHLIRNDEILNFRDPLMGRKELHEELKRQSSQTRGEQDFPIYRLPFRSITAKDQYRLGEDEGELCLTVLLLGLIGSGKSMLMEVLGNYGLGVDFLDRYRFQVKEDGPTEKIISHTFFTRDKSRFPRPVTFIDTPGFQRGKPEMDQKLVEDIRAYICSKHEQGIHAIIYVVPGSQGRLTAEQKMVLRTMAQILGEETDEISYLFCTFADSKRLPVLESVKEAGFRCKIHFPVNSSSYFAKDKVEEMDESSSDESNNYPEEGAKAGSIDQLLWNMTTDGICKFIEDIQRNKPVSIQPPPGPPGGGEKERPCNQAVKTGKPDNNSGQNKIPDHQKEINSTRIRNEVNNGPPSKREPSVNNQENVKAKKERRPDNGRELSADKEVASSGTERTIQKEQGSCDGHNAQSNKEAKKNDKKNSFRGKRISKVDTGPENSGTTQKMEGTYGRSCYRWMLKIFRFEVMLFRVVGVGHAPPLCKFARLGMVSLPPNWLGQLSKTTAT